jgi:hypothetical protein
MREPLLELRMPRVGEAMKAGRVHKLLAAPGTRVERGTPLLEVRVDLTGVAEQNCTPVSYFRIVARESAVLRDVVAAVGDEIRVGDLLATLGPAEGGATEGVRPLRINVGVVPCLQAS